ncbi:hypothetical protein VN12_25765 [Pirellula sp. SH-Sr6A]|uniref:hypothetical protein n=1 Tax=Pirellula sp. SH-Sr6A TaxID=1632865 RepID=UPI00078C0EED|nr:hypothetical protein [Pirellula sp. SH-Sr6A]AMV35525.1 hypothetical protein VN12_25765 [Pirellula sp. SH-Sr6A]
MAKKKKSSNAGKGFNAKEFLLFHAEKIVFALIAALSLTLVFLGFSGQKFSASKSPEDLKKKAESTLASAISQDHWEQIKEAEPERVTNVSYARIASETRGEVQAGNYVSRIWKEPPGMAARRGDPELKAPIKLQGQFFSAPIPGRRPSDPFESLQDAKKPEEKQPPRRGRGNPGMGQGGYGGMEGGSGGGYGAEGSGSGYPGSGSGYPGSGGSGTGTGLAGNIPTKRFLSPGYDRGYKLGMITNPQAAFPKPPTPQEAKTNRYVVPTSNYNAIVVTAIVEHQDLEKNYSKEFADVPEYIERRDTPYYQGFEVQRVEVTSDATDIPDDAWKTVDAAGSEAFKEKAKEFIGTCKEVNNPVWTHANITMPIPPVLLMDYRPMCSHPDIPSDIPELIRDDEGAPGQTGSFGMGGYGSGGYGAGGYGSEMGGYGSGSGYGGEMAGGSGYGMGGSEMGSGSGYGSEMAGSGYGSGGYGAEGSGSGYGSGGYGAEGSGSGYGGEGGLGGSYGGMGGTAGLGMQLPTKLPSTKYKLVRFFDPTAEAGKSYRYRVRLMMYDPNFPEFEIHAPKTMNLKPDAMSRVQDLKMKVVPDKTKGNKRKSERLSPWSAPSDPILAAAPTPVFAGEVEKPSLIRLESGEQVESRPTKTELVTLNNVGTINFAIKDSQPVTRGHIIAGTHKPNKEGYEFVHPTLKVLKIPKKIREEVGPKVNIVLPNVLVTVLDVGGGTPLRASTSKDELLAGGEVVCFDAKTGQIVVGREFEDYTDYNGAVKPDEPAIGPLGAGMGGAAGTGSGYGAEGSGPGGSGPGGPGMGGPGMGGPGMGGGAGY